LENRIKAWRMMASMTCTTLGLAVMGSGIREIAGKKYLTVNTAIQ
jgi:hypothetical protein